MKKRGIKIGLFAAALIILLFCGFVYFTMGLFVVQPIGAIPDGTTVVYWRLGTNLSFISSADGLILAKGEGVSLISRGIVLGAVAKVMENRKIINLPYSETLYLISTGGVKFEK